MEDETIVMQYTDEGFAKGLGQETTLVRDCATMELPQVGKASEVESIHNVACEPVDVQAHGNCEHHRSRGIK